MLYELFNAKKETDGDDVFTSRVSDEIAQNLNPKFELREYQKEVLGRFDFYFSEYRGRKSSAQLLFEGSKEGWKQDFLLELESKANTDLKLENRHFKLIGLPFYNEKLKKEFEEALENKILK